MFESPYANVDLYYCKILDASEEIKLTSCSLVSFLKFFFPTFPFPTYFFLLFLFISSSTIVYSTD